MDSDDDDDDDGSSSSDEKKSKKVFEKETVQWKVLFSFLIDLEEIKIKQGKSVARQKWPG